MLTSGRTLKVLQQVRSFSTRAANLGRPKLPPAKNEPFLNYNPGSPERAKLREACEAFRKTPVKIPIVINGKEIFAGEEETQYIPSDNKKALAVFHKATKTQIEEAIQGSLKAKEKWHSMPFVDRCAIFLKAADLLSTKYRAKVCAATVLGQSKTAWQAEIDAAVELCDFWRFNAKYAEEIYDMQPPQHSTGVWNHLEYRPLDGFVAAVSPFNFTAIGGNLCSAPAIMGNSVVWKPAPTSMLSSYLVFQVLREAGLPDGVIQFIPADGPTFGDTILASKDFGGLHFTGSTKTFNHLLKKAYTNLEHYRSYPRVVGETGGKDFHFVHESADVDHVVASTIRGAFEYQGQKCSATSRMYVPDNLWPEMKSKLVSETKKIKMGQSDDFSSFMAAVIDKNSFNKISGYIEEAKKSKACEIIVGGKCDDSVGYFVEPTIIVTSDPNFKTIQEEIFGPVLTIYVYNHQQYEKGLELCSQTSPYALTGSIFAKDREAILFANEKLRFSAGNFYINDKCTGAMVGQQPFGGSRASGTNDKSGAVFNLLRWVSVRSIKENFIHLPLGGWTYSHISSDK